MDPAYKRYFRTVALIWAICFLVLGLLYVFLVVPQQETVDIVEGELAGRRIEYNIFKNAASTKAKTELISQIDAIKAYPNSPRATND